MRSDPLDVIGVMVGLTALAWFLLLCFGCVTRTTVCVEAAHGLGHRDAYGARPDSAGASVCAELERP